MYLESIPDSERIELLDADESSDDGDLRERNGNAPHDHGRYAQTFTGSGQLVENVKHYQKHHQNQIEHPTEPFNDVYDFYQAKWLINSKRSLTKINESLSSGL